MKTDRSLTRLDAAVIKGMLARGDIQSDIAAVHLCNGGRISEIKTGKRFADVCPAPRDKLPPPPFRTRKFKGVTFNQTNKFDIQLSQSKINEQNLAAIFSEGKIELKTESYLWERSRNICIEFMQNGKPSGIAVTEAEQWVHELKFAINGQTIVRLMFPIERLKELCARAAKCGRVRHNVGDGGRFSVYLISLREIFE